MCNSYIILKLAKYKYYYFKREICVYIYIFDDKYNKYNNYCMYISIVKFN